jgi:hypothetical protein
MNFIAPLIVFSIVIITLYVSLMHPRHINSLNWAFLITGTLFVFIMSIWAQGIPNGLIFGLLCSPVIFFVGYMRLFRRKKFGNMFFRHPQRRTNHANGYSPKHDVLMNPTPKTWKFLGRCLAGDTFLINGVNVWSGSWQIVTGEQAYVKDPLYGQDFSFQVYTITVGEKQIKFAAGEFSNMVWGFYIPE